MARSCVTVVEVDLETRQVRGRFSGVRGCATACGRRRLWAILSLLPLPTGQWGVPATYWAHVLVGEPVPAPLPKGPWGVPAVASKVL